jgi:hypothetical protein
VQPAPGHLNQIDERRQEARERLAAPGRCDQQRRRIVRPRQHVELMGVRRPAFGGKPVGQDRGKGHVSKDNPEPIGKEGGKVFLKGTAVPTTEPAHGPV